MEKFFNKHSQQSHGGKPNKSKKKWIFIEWFEYHLSPKLDLTILTTDSSLSFQTP